MYRFSLFKFSGGRSHGHNTGYTHILVLDFDKLTDEELAAIRAIVINCEYTFGCFLSPSGAGLKVFVVVSTEADQHLQAFLSVQRYYEALTGAKIDPSGKDIARLCFISADENLYCNQSATIFVPTLEPDKPKNRPKYTISAAPTDAYADCIAKASQKYSFIEGSRHNFVFELALQLRSAGFDERTSLILLKNDYNYDENDVCNAVKSVYGYYWADSEKRSRAAIPNADLPDENRQPDLNNDTESDPGSQDPPTEPPTPKKKGTREKFDMTNVEKLLKTWYETRYNEVTGTVEWRHAKTKGPFNRLIDYDENTMFRQLYHAGEHIPVHVLHALINSNFSKAFNPFLTYFKQLPKWDGVTDYIGQLCDTVKTEDDAYWAFCFRKWFVAYAASLVNDETINHTVIVLVGSQGSGKTTWMKRLLPAGLSKYLGTAALQPDNKDTTIQLTECGLIILDEMESLNRNNLSSFKEMITRPEIRIRRPYGRNSENLPRRASFVASVNHEQILTDTSGSRRYLCSKVISIDYQHTVDIDKALAQAIALYKSGFRFWFDKEEIKTLNKSNESFIAKSVEEELIETLTQPVSMEEWKTRHQFVNGQTIQLLTATQIANKLSEKTRLVLNDQTVVKVGKALNKNGYNRLRSGNSYKYLIRFIENDAVEKMSRTYDDPENPSADDLTAILMLEKKDNDQNHNLNDDLQNLNHDGDLPF